MLGVFAEGRLHFGSKRRTKRLGLEISLSCVSMELHVFRDCQPLGQTARTATMTRTPQ
jgi:hypothetical protein